jgi:hypothetical protein
VILGTDCAGSWKSNYYTTTTANTIFLKKNNKTNIDLSLKQQSVGRHVSPLGNFAACLAEKQEKKHFIVLV